VLPVATTGQARLTTGKQVCGHVRQHNISYTTIWAVTVVEDTLYGTNVAPARSFACSLVCISVCCGMLRTPDNSRRYRAAAVTYRCTLTHFLEAINAAAHLKHKVQPHKHRSAHWMLRPQPRQASSRGPAQPAMPPSVSRASRCTAHICSITLLQHDDMGLRKMFMMFHASSRSFDACMKPAQSMSQGIGRLPVLPAGHAIYA
jgi:hypothetical protein